MVSKEMADAGKSTGAIVRSTFERIFAGDMSVIVEHPGLASLQKAFPSMLAAFPDFSAEFKQQLIDGDRVAMHWIFRGTHKGELYGVPPTGKSVQFQNLSISRVENGRIVAYNSEVGWLAVFREIGVLPFHSSRELK
ncbi:MAG: ester cyclase [Gemmatimonadaceae bacterium]